MGLTDWLFGGRKRARLPPDVGELCQELSLAEAKLGLAEMLAGLKVEEFYIAGGLGGLNQAKLRRDIEITANLYVYVRGLEGAPASWSEEGRYRVALTRASLNALKARTYQEKFRAMSDFFAADG
jgi:hypothetical protein